MDGPLPLNSLHTLGSCFTISFMFLIKMTFISTWGQYPYKPSFSLTPLFVLIVDDLNWNCYLIFFFFSQRNKQIDSDSVLHQLLPPEK